LLRVLRLGGLGAGTVALGSWLHARSAKPQGPSVLLADPRVGVAADPSLPELVVVQGESPEALVRRALDDLGGIRRFIARGDVVVVKPNIGWDRSPEQGANTNPEVVAALVVLCHEAGARKVIVTDVSCNEARVCFANSGIADAARKAGAEVILPEERRFREVNLGGEVLTTWPVLEPFLAADKVINVPIAKHHSLTGCTLGMKNFYGIIGGQRSRLHQRIHDSLVDLLAFARPTLTVLDAYRVMMRGGPTGGSLGDVEFRKTVIAGTDPVAIDAYAAKAYWDLDHYRLPFLRIAQARGLGTPNFEDVRSTVVNI
ncbi:MAG TPA: DUF362 domain-containing protein, partial [Vicinamibacterales bacterium]|nr:DUF362 domain-containing protein [Vicinamibacterales bacterium]